jgi:ABC-type glycerol-3-phosphate transport system substrate-binding protein
MSIRVAASRRAVLRGSGAALGLLATPTIVRAQSRELIFWTTQRAPEQIAAYKAIFAGFEKQHPGTTVTVQSFLEEELLPKLAATLAAGTPPDLISHMPPEFVMQLNEQGLLQPVDEIIKTVGEGDFYENSLELLRDSKRGYYPGFAIVNSTTTGALWYRKDLVGDAGAAGYAGWDAMLETAKRTNRRGVFGTIYPFGKTSMGDKLLLQTIWRAGGYIINPDGSVGFNSPATVAAFEFIRDLLKFSPAGSANYAYTETVNGFVEGRAASAPYSGRVLINVQAQNPKLADSISVAPFPMPTGGRDVFVGDFQSMVIPKAAKDQELSKQMALTLLKTDNYVRFLHVTPSHNLPNLKSVAASAEFSANPTIAKYHAEVDTMIAATAKGRSLLKESLEHTTNTQAGAILGSRVMVEALQDVIIGGMSPQAAAARGADRIAGLMKA